MAFGSIGITTVTRTQDYTTIKQNEDNKAMIDQSHVGHHIQKETKQRAQQVSESDNTEWHNKKFDAKEKGDNEYSGDGGRQRREEPKEKVVVKGHQGFDIKI